MKSVTSARLQDLSLLGSPYKAVHCVFHAAFLGGPLREFCSSVSCLSQQRHDVEHASPSYIIVMANRCRRRQSNNHISSFLPCGSLIKLIANDYERPMHASERTSISCGCVCSIRQRNLMVFCCTQQNQKATTPPLHLLIQHQAHPHHRLLLRQEKRAQKQATQVVGPTLA